MPRPMNIHVLDDYQDTVRTLPAFEKTAGHQVTIWRDHTKDVNVLAERLKDAEALTLIRERTPIGAALVERLPKLRIVSQLGAYPHIDVQACTRRAVAVCSDLQPGRPSYSTAELTWGLIIAAMRRIPQEAAALKAGKWQAYSMGTGLRGKTLGIYGYGRISGVLARYAKAFGVKPLVWAREASRQRARADGCEIAASKEEFFETSDIVTLQMRLVDATRGIVTGAELARMKPTSLFINTSRAGLVEAGALAAALRAGRPAMAAVDVFEEEPVPGGHNRLLEMDNVVATPHLGYVERENFNHMFNKIFDQILAYAAGNPINVVNPEALKQRPAGA